MRIRSRMAPIALTSVMLGGGMAAATAATASADAPKAGAQIQSCYGSAKNYKAEGSGTTAIWPAGTAWAKTTGNCADINIKVNYNRHVKICYRHGCGDYQYAKAGQWKVLDDNVPNGWEFYLEFSGGNDGTGKVAY